MDNIEACHSVSAAHVGGEAGGEVSHSAANDVTGSMRGTSLIIRDIEVENFKSYYGQHRIGPFHRTFTAVIGPNGSGKSNVIDAMLFVFGRNAKKIRLDKLSELIHSSAMHSDVTYASVTVNFIRVLDDPDADVQVEVPNTELRVTREVYKSGASQYFINGVRSSQKEVVALLIEQGVDLEHNRFLILQGEVEQIALMKCKAEKEGEEGLLEYLDDLIGSSDLVDTIAEASRAAESAQTERMHALDREQKLRAECDALADAKNSALAFVTKDNHLQKTLIVMCQLRMRGIEERLVEPRRLLQEIDVRVGHLESELQQRQREKSAAEESVVRVKKELVELTKEREAARSRKSACDAELERVKSGLEEQERARRRLQDGLKKSKEVMSKALLQQQDCEREGVIVQQNVEEATQQLQQISSEYEALAQRLLPQLGPLRQAMEEKKRTTAPFERAVAEAQEQLSTAQSRLDALEEQLRRRQTRVQQLEDEAESRALRLRELTEWIEKDERERQLQENSNDKNNTTNTNNNNNNTPSGAMRREDELRQLQETLAEATQRKFAINAVIQERKRSYCEGEADDKTMEFLLSQRALKGYYGTLRQLGRIDEAYDVAAGVASHAWGFHVVHDRPTAVSALELLKRYGMGRVTVMVMSEIEREVGERMRRSFTAPNAKAKRLFDLITPTHEKFRGVFYQAVRDTLVVDTLSEARETAFGGQLGAAHMPQGRNSTAHATPASRRFRVVTRAGELVEPAGTITGGGGVPRGAKLKAARCPLDKRAMRDELQRLQAELIAAAEEERGLQQRVHDLSQQIHDAHKSHRRHGPSSSVHGCTHDAGNRNNRTNESTDEDEEEHDTPEERRQRWRSELERVRVIDETAAVVLAERRRECQACLDTFDHRRAALLHDRAVAEEACAAAQRAQQCAAEEFRALEAACAEAGGSALADMSASREAAQQRCEAAALALRRCQRQTHSCRATWERAQAEVSRYEAELAAMEAAAAAEAEAEAEAVAAAAAAHSGTNHSNTSMSAPLPTPLARATQRVQEMAQQLHLAETHWMRGQQRAEEARAAVPECAAAVLEVQRRLDDEQRYRQTEASKMADALQELAKFEQKIEGCEEKIRENVDLYGGETLQREPGAQEDTKEDDWVAEEAGEERCLSAQDESDTNDDEAGEAGESDHENENDREESVASASDAEESPCTNTNKEEEGSRGANEEEETTASDAESRSRRVSDSFASGGVSGGTHDEQEEEEEEETHTIAEGRSGGEDASRDVREQRNSGNNNNNNNNKSSLVSAKGKSSHPPHRRRRRRRGGGGHRDSSGSDARTTGASSRRVLTAAEVRRMSFKLSPEALSQCDYDRSVHLAKALSEETRRLHGEIDFRAVALWRERDVAHRRVKADYEARKKCADAAESALLQLKERRRVAFMTVFAKIRVQLRHVYQLLTHGGDADMELVDVNDPFEGINFVVRPPKKSWKQISNLSGGEKTLSSLALIFALHHIKPTPIYVMDEIDAALDFRNVSIVADYVLRQAGGAQFIIISLRNNMFEMAHQLVGVCKVHDVTTTLVMRPRAFPAAVARALTRVRNSRRSSGHIITNRNHNGNNGEGMVTRGSMDVDKVGAENDVRSATEAGGAEVVTVSRATTPVSSGRPSRWTGQLEEEAVRVTAIP